MGGQGQGTGGDKGGGGISNVRVTASSESTSPPCRVEKLHPSPSLSLHGPSEYSPRVECSNPMTFRLKQDSSRIKDDRGGPRWFSWHQSLRVPGMYGALAAREMNYHFFRSLLHTIHTYGLHSSRHCMRWARHKRMRGDGMSHLHRIPP